MKGAVLGIPILGTLLLTQDPTAPFPRAGAYLGAAACRECHEDEWDAISAGHHRPAVHGEGVVGCETCHGPGRAHGRDEDNDPRLITHPPTLAPAEQGRVCEQCHRDQMAAHGGDPEGFLAAGQGCTSCHIVHQQVPAVPRPGEHYERRVDLAAAAGAPVGADRCTRCHPLRDALLQVSHHHALAAGADPRGCEGCHGPGALHVETGGLQRLITRPDRARDGMATCRSCHAEVHPREFHWQGRRSPLLSADLTCTSCHRVHEPVAGAHPTGERAGVDPGTGEVVPGRAPPTNRLCESCHAPAFEVLRGTIHQALGRLDLPLAIGCGSCHAGAEAHARGGGRAHLVESMHGTDARYQERTCGACHDGDPSLRHTRVGAHFRRDVTCLQCHSPAAPLGKVREDAEQKCASCHADVAAQFRLPNRHPVPEGRMGCSDCHDPHGARPKLHDRQLTQESCVSCHRQYRGPFVFAHQASRLDGCVACHVPHGATNRRLLEHATTQQSCLQCHGDFPAFHDQTPGAVFTNCVSCHTEVHGSNHSRYLFR